MTDRRKIKRRNYITGFFGKTAEYFDSRKYPLYGIFTRKYMPVVVIKLIVF